MDNAGITGGKIHYTEQNELDGHGMAHSNPSSSVIKIISGSKGRYPIKLGIVPERLAVTISRHSESYQGNKVQFLSYLTDGLSALKQKELLLTLLVDENAQDSHFPATPFPFFIAIFKQALQNKFVSIGDLTNLGAKGLFGFAGVGYSFVPSNFLGLTLSRPTLCCVLLTRHEWLIAQNYSFTRVLTHLGYTYKRFPFLPWVDRHRVNHVMNKAVLNSVLKSTAKLVLKNSSVFMAQGDTVILQLSRAALAPLSTMFRQHADGTPFALVLQLLSSHDGSLVWRAETDETEFNTAPQANGEALAGCFLLLTPGAGHDGATIREDGFSMLFREKSWEEFKSAVVRGQNWTTPGMQGAMNFAVYIGDMNQQVSTNVLSGLGNDISDSVDEKANVFSSWMDRIRALLSRE